MLLIIILLSIVYNILLIFSKDNKSETIKNKNSEKLKKWEFTTTIIVSLIFWLTFCIIIIKFSKISNIFCVIFNTILFLKYISVLVNILMKKNNDKITENELSYLTTIPAIYAILCNTKFYKNLLQVINQKFGNSIGYFMFENIFKYFVVMFFLTIIIFLIIMKLKEKIHIDRNFKYIEFNENEYIYKNARGNKGINFIKNYLKDIFILFKLIIGVFFQRLFWIPIIYILETCIIFFKKLTMNFSIYTIIIKTFNISIIISLLITYYQLLCNFKEDIIIELYSVIITTIIIPIILNIISELKLNK